MLQNRFSNQFLDNLITNANPHEQARLLRTFGCGLDRKEISDFLNMDVHSIRRYESEWNTAPIPQWYFHILRFLAGDLSIYGELWTDAKIKLHNQCITTAFTPYEEFTPKELHMKYSIINRQNEREIEEKNRIIDRQEKEIQRLSEELRKLELKKNSNVIEIVNYRRQ